MKFICRPRLGAGRMTDLGAIARNRLTKLGCAPKVLPRQGTSVLPRVPRQSDTADIHKTTASFLKASVGSSLPQANSFTNLVWKGKKKKKKCFSALRIYTETATDFSFLHTFFFFFLRDGSPLLFFFFEIFFKRFCNAVLFIRVQRRVIFYCSGTDPINQDFSLKHQQALH